MDLGLKDKTALVAASSKGLGKATAMALAHEGCRVAICARDGETLAAAGAEIREATGANVLEVGCDLADPGAIAALFARVAEALGGPDVVVINAGGPPVLPLNELTDEHWRKAFELTVMSAVRMVNASLPHMREAKWGRIVAIESSSVKQPVAGLHLSNGLRPGVAGYFKSILEDLAKDGITINTVLPGVYLTDRILNNQKGIAERTGVSLEDRLDLLRSSIPMGRFGEPHELGSMVAFLASEQAAYVTGAVVQVDGGLIRSVV